MPEAAEAMRRQREQYGSPAFTEAPTVPVDMPAVPVPVEMAPATPSPAQVEVSHRRVLEGGWRCNGLALCSCFAAAG
jgi:hypothetical protein